MGRLGGWGCGVQIVMVMVGTVTRGQVGYNVLRYQLLVVASSSTGCFPIGPKGNDNLDVTPTGLNCWVFPFSA